MKAKDFRFSQEALSLFLKGLNLYKEETLIVAYRIEIRCNNVLLIITYYDENYEMNDVEIYLGYDKNLINF